MGNYVVYSGGISFSEIIITLQNYILRFCFVPILSGTVQNREFDSFFMEIRGLYEWCLQNQKHHHITSK